MHYKAISAALLLAPAVLANPVVTDTPNYDDLYSDYSDLYSDNDFDGLNSVLDNIPTSILTVLATAIPASWYMELMDPAAQSSFLSEASAGVYPDWYSALPSSVIAWASSAAEDGDNFLFGSATATATDDSSSGSSGSSRTASVTATATATASATATQGETDDESSTASSSKSEATTATSDAPSSSNASSNTASSAASSTPSSETSTGGAALATGSVAMSFAGAAGLLGLVAVL